MDSSSEVDSVYSKRTVEPSVISREASPINHGVNGDDGSDAVYSNYLRVMQEETLPMLESYPPTVVQPDPREVLKGSLDLLLWRGLADALEVCIAADGSSSMGADGSTSALSGLSQMNPEQLAKLSKFARTRVIPAYITFFRDHFFQPTYLNEPSFYFFVRQENNASWPKLIWTRIKQIFLESRERKDEGSHELGVSLPSGALDVLARLMELFFPMESVQVTNKGSCKILNRFAFGKFEKLGFDLRADEPEILEAVLQRALIERDDPLMAKNAYYILTRIISFSREYSVFDAKSGDLASIFIWNPSDLKARNWEQYVVAFGALQESQVHLVLPLLPVVKKLVREMPTGWWRVLLQRGLLNDSMPIRRCLLRTIFELDPQNYPSLCTPDGLDFSLGDLLTVGIDPNSSFFVVSSNKNGESDTEDAAGAMDLGECAALYYARLIDAYAVIDGAHGRAFLREFLLAIEASLRAPVGLIYVIKAFSRVRCAVFPALEDLDLGTLIRIATQPSLHNQRARLLVKWQIAEIIMVWADSQGISFVQLAATLNALLLESITVGTLRFTTEEFAKIAAWLESCFGSSFLRESLSISIERFFSSSIFGKSLNDSAEILATCMVFSLGASDGRFVSFTRPIFEQLTLVSSMGIEDAREAVPAFVLFLALNSRVKAVLSDSETTTDGPAEDLISQLNLSGKIFDWLSFLENSLFSSESGSLLRCRVDFVAAEIFLDSFALLLERANENDEKQLMQYLDIHAFSLINYLKSGDVGGSSETKVEVPTAANTDDDVEEEQDRDDTLIDVGFGKLLTIFTVMRGLRAVLDKLRVMGHLRLSILDVGLVDRIIRFPLERPAALKDAEWDSWPAFVTAFTAAKWQCIEAMAQALQTVSGSAQSETEALLSIYASCLQALEVSKYGGTLAILNCISTLLDLILAMHRPTAESSTSSAVSRQLHQLFERTFSISQEILRGGSETQRWFDAYAEAIIRLHFRPCVLSHEGGLSDVLHEAFDFFVSEVGPKRRGIVALISARLGEFFIRNVDVLAAGWRAELLKLVCYGPVRSSCEEVVAARLSQRSFSDNDYQVRVHALTVFNHLPRQSELFIDFLNDLLGQQDVSYSSSTLSQRRNKIFPGDAGHRARLRSWAAILFLVRIMCITDGLEVGYALKELLPTLWRFIELETMASTRTFMEWTLILVYLKYPERLISEDFMALRIGYRDVAAGLVVSMLSIAVILSRNLVQSDEAYATAKLIPYLADYALPLLAHNNHMVRMHAIYAFKELYGIQCQYHLNRDVLGYKLLSGFIEGAAHCQKFIGKLQQDIMLSPGGLDPLEDCNIDWIFGKMMRVVGVEGEVIEHFAFKNYYEKPGFVPYEGEASSSQPRAAADPLETLHVTPVLVPLDVEGLFKDFQQKIDIYSPFAADENGGDESQLSSSLKLMQSSAPDLETEIVVIGSLVDKLPNLAGLARTCEIFGVKTLYVADLAILSSPDFINVAMTAERWLDIRQLPEEGIPRFLEELKTKEGFRVVALEQTSNSVALNQYSFPGKTCLVLGRERTGVPAEVLHLVDDCVEIPQFGRVRSLNVHVSASIAIWKAREQDLL